MSVEQLESKVLALPLDQRRAFTRWLDEHRDEIEQPSVLARAQESEVLRHAHSFLRSRRRENVPRIR
jgi:hypothetical protein